MENSNENLDPLGIGELNGERRDRLISVNKERIDVLEKLIISLTKEALSMKGVVGNLGMKVMGNADQGFKRLEQIERDAKLLVAVLVADFKEGKTTGIPIEAGVLTESLGFKRPTDVYLDVEKKGL